MRPKKVLGKIYHLQSIDFTEFVRGEKSPKN